MLLELKENDKTVAVDFDDVIVPFTENMVKYLSDSGIARGSMENLKSTSFNEIFGCDDERAKELFEIFVTSESWMDMHFVPPMKGCEEKLKDMKKRGYRLIVVSARETRFKRITQEYLSRYLDGIFDDVYVCNYYGKTSDAHPRLSKSDVCRTERCVALIDDNYAYVKEAENNTEMKCILLGSWSWTLHGASEINKERTVHAKTWEDVDVFSL